MKIFISWSGDRSRIVASALKKWLPDVIQTLDVWMSDHDIDAGAKWNSELDKILQSSSFGVLCLTRENQVAPWLLFEAGALSKTQEIVRVIPYLLGLTPTDVQFPLAQFQGVQADKEGTYRLLQSINEAGSLNISSEKLERAFVRWWPDLENELKKVPTPDKKTVPSRTDRDILEEILGLLRSNSIRTAKHWSSELNYMFEKEDDAVGVVWIDACEFFGETSFQGNIPYFPKETVSDFLDRVWTLLIKMRGVPAYTYGDLWLLVNQDSGYRYDNIGIEYCRSKGSVRDRRIISKVGIFEGARLKVERLDSSQL